MDASVYDILLQSRGLCAWQKISKKRIAPQSVYSYQSRLYVVQEKNVVGVGTSLTRPGKVVRSETAIALSSKRHTY